MEGGGGEMDWEGERGSEGSKCVCLCDVCMWGRVRDQVSCVINTLFSDCA